MTSTRDKGVADYVTTSQPSSFSGNACYYGVCQEQESYTTWYSQGNFNSVLFYLIAQLATPFFVSRGQTFNARE